jgi:hypothetical protein
MRSFHDKGKAMKKVYVLNWLIVCAFFLFGNWTHAEEPHGSALEFVKDLKSGDVHSILSRSGGNFLRKKDRLLAENKEHGNFLRKSYLGAVFSITEVTRVHPNAFLVGIEASYENGNKAGSKLLIERGETGKGSFLRSLICASEAPVDAGYAI